MNDTLPNLDQLPTLDDSERLQNLLDAIGEAKKRRQSLRERAEQIEQSELPQIEEKIEDLRVDVATGDATESDLDAAKEERAELEQTLEDLRQDEIPAQEETIELLEDRRSEVKSDEGDKLAGEYAQVQRALQSAKRELLQKLAQVCDRLDEYQGLKKNNDVGSYDPDVPNVPPVHPVVKGQSRSDNMEPQQLRRRAEELKDTLAQMDDSE